MNNICLFPSVFDIFRPEFLSDFQKEGIETVSSPDHNTFLICLDFSDLDNGIPDNSNIPLLLFIKNIGFEGLSEEQILEKLYITVQKKSYLKKIDFICTDSPEIYQFLSGYISRKVLLTTNNFKPLDELIKEIFQLQENFDPDKIYLYWEGSQFINHSLAIVNREISLKLLENQQIDLSLIPYEKHFFSEIEKPRFAELASLFYKYLPRKDFLIKHKWPPDFDVPNELKLIIMQPWEMGSIPKDWFEPFLKLADQIWVYCQANKNEYSQSGIPEDKIKVIPLGVRKELYQKKIQPMELNTIKSFRFLFNGGTIFRKGVDILLSAYLEEFSHEEDVCLVIKDVAISNIYSNNFREEIEAEAKKTDNPEILYFQKDLSDEELLSLYHAVNAYVHPYRGEGFGLPIIEAMACGLPVIVTGYGSALDFCNSENSYLLDYEMLHLDEKSFNNIPLLSNPSFPEVKKESIKYWMRYVFENYQEALDKGRKARDFVLKNNCWQNSADAILANLKTLSVQPVFRHNIAYYLEKYLDRAIEEYKNKNYQKSYSLLKQALNLSAENPEINYYLGLNTYYLNNYEKSLDYFTNACKYGLNGKNAYKYIALCLESLGDDRTARLIRQKYNN